MDLEELSKIRAEEDQEELFDLLYSTGYIDDEAEALRLLKQLKEEPPQADPPAFGSADGVSTNPTVAAVPLELWQLIVKHTSDFSPSARYDYDSGLWVVSNLSRVNKHWNYWAFECMYCLKRLTRSSYRMLKYLTEFPQRIKQKYANLKVMVFLPEGYSVEFGDKHLAMAAPRFPALIHLDTCPHSYFSKNISDDGLRSIASLKQLTFLDLTKIRGSDISILSSLQKLRTLSLHKAEYEFQEIPPLTSLVSLISIDLNDNPLEVDAWWGQLTSIRRLTRGYEVTSPYRSVKHYPNLVSLTIQGSNAITAANWNLDIPKLTQLKEFHLDEIQPDRASVVLNLVCTHMLNIRSFTMYTYSEPHGAPIPWARLAFLKKLRVIRTVLLDTRQKEILDALKKKKVQVYY